MPTRCIRVRVHPDQLARAREWMAGFAARADEAREAMRQNGLTSEAVFLEHGTDGANLLMVQTGDDFAATSAAFLTSTLAIDVEAREVLPQLGDRGVELDCLVELRA